MLKAEIRCRLAASVWIATKSFLAAKKCWQGMFDKLVTLTFGQDPTKIPGMACRNPRSRGENAESPLVQLPGHPFQLSDPQKLISSLPTLVHEGSESLIRLNNLFSPCLHHLP